MTEANVGDWRDVLMMNPVGSHYDGTDISSAVTLTPATGATKLMIQALDQAVRITLDGTTPTTVKGFQLAAGDPAIIIPLGKDTTIKVIEEAATADIQYQWGS